MWDLVAEASEEDVGRETEKESETCWHYCQGCGTFFSSFMKPSSSQKAFGVLLVTQSAPCSAAASAMG